MKKICPETGDFRFEAYSSTDGITINPVRSYGPIALLSFRAVKASLLRNGSITCRRVEFHSQTTTDDLILAHEAFKARVATQVLSFVLLIAFFALIFTSHVRLSEIIFALFLLSRSFEYVAYPVIMFIKCLFGNKHVKQLARFHSAEHAVINAFYDLQRIPTLEEIREYSSYSYGCGSLIGFKQAIVYFGFGLARFVPGLACLPAMLIMAILSVILIKTNKIIFLEFLVLNRPTDTEYKVAIKAMEESLKNVAVEPNLDDFLSIVLPGILVGVSADNFDEEICKGCPSFDKCKSKQGSCT